MGSNPNLSHCNHWEQMRILKTVQQITMLMGAEMMWQLSYLVVFEKSFWNLLSCSGV